jgi:uncharacterized iron-regulated membrane protein
LFRKTVFWIHLAVGVATGLVVVMMSVTGVILTYERQMIVWSDRAYYQEPAPEDHRQPLDDLIAAATGAQLQPASLTIFSDASAPVIASGGRQGAIYLDPYSAEVLGEPEQGLRGFFSAVTGWHRWFNATGDQRVILRAVTGVSNLAFLFLICTGLYLWLPKLFRWPLFRARLRFENSSGTSQQRDFNWHHVYGFWSAIPLFVVIATAVVFSYPWANNLVYQSVGESVPTGGMGMGMGMGVVLPGSVPGSNVLMSSPPNRLPLDSLFARAATQLENWQGITVQLPRGNATSVIFTIDQGDGGQPQKRHTLTLNAETGDAVRWDPFTSLSVGAQTRQWIRRLHTGEAYGTVGQAIAGIVSFTSLIMVWTGFALAYRRLILPLFRRDSS